jgi:succinate dehydrogenase flavin-adding protein (antitoxin of CptAB toxin-antitoxin module)
MEKATMNPKLEVEDCVRADSSSAVLPGSRVDPRRLARLRWRCRRGMLENDLILERFLDARGDAITEPELAALDRVLALGDDELWDLLSGRRAPEDAALAPLVAALRAV